MSGERQISRSTVKTVSEHANRTPHEHRVTAADTKIDKLQMEINRLAAEKIENEEQIARQEKTIQMIAAATFNAEENMEEWKSSELAKTKQRLESGLTADDEKGDANLIGTSVPTGGTAHENTISQTARLSLSQQVIEKEGVTDLQAILTSANLSQYIDVLHSANVATIEEFNAKMDDDALQALQINKKGHRKKLMKVLNRESIRIVESSSLKNNNVTYAWQENDGP